jgi:hypothetical protein
MYFDRETGLLIPQLWNPADTFPRFANNRLSACVHSYNIPLDEAALKAEKNGWNYQQPVYVTPTGEVTLDDYYLQRDDGLWNIILLDGKDVTGWVNRPEMKLLVAPVGGYPDKGSLYTKSHDWKKTAGKSIFAANEAVGLAFDKWKSIMSQLLRDTTPSITQEFSAEPKATPEQLRERGALFHYSPGEAGLRRLETPQIPLELQAHLLEIRRELQKGSFTDAVYGMVEGQPGYALSLLSTSSANQILYPYMDSKHFLVSELDRFWLSNLKSSNRVFPVRGKLMEKLSPSDIPEEVEVIVESDVATPKDWLERGTIGNMLKDQLDEATIITEIYRLPDPQGIRRRKAVDKMLEHPLTQSVQLISEYYVHADYLDSRGDRRQAALFRKAAQALEGQLGLPEPGQATPAEMTRVSAQREAPAPEARTRVSPQVLPPEQQGFTPQTLRRVIGTGKIRR